jgi:hypothetical protein
MAFERELPHWERGGTRQPRGEAKKNNSRKKKKTRIKNGI